MTSRVRDAAFVARKDLAYLLRQRETLVWTFLMPPLFFYFIGTVTGGGFGGDGSGEPPRLAVRAPADAGFLVDALVARLEGEGFEVARFAAGPGAAPPDVKAAEPGNAGGPTREGGATVPADSGPPFDAYARRLTVPDPEGTATFTEAVLAGEGPVSLVFAQEGESPSVSFDELRVKRAVYGLLADLAVLRVEAASTAEGAAGAGTRERTGEGAASADAGTPALQGAPAAVGPAGFRRLREMPRALTVRTVAAGRRVEAPSGFDQAIPGILVMFTMLVLLTSGAILLVIERRQGLLRRLASTPITRGSVVAGKWASKMALGIVQIAFGMLAGALLFGYDWAGAPVGLAAVLLAWAAFNASLGIVLGSVARTEAQMAGIGVLATMVLAALGGCWWPIEITPGWMQTLALALPTGWAMDALHALVSFGRGTGAVVPHVLALTGSTFLLGWAGVRLFRYE